MLYKPWMIYKPYKKLKGDIRGYTRYCGEMQLTPKCSTGRILREVKIAMLYDKQCTTACATAASLCATIESYYR